MKAYKLTDKNGQTKNRTQWGENVTHVATGTHDKLCSDGWIHFYKDPLIAILLNPIHARFLASPRLWECETGGEELHEPLKSGCKKLTTIREIPIPQITLNQKIAFGILCVLEVFKESKFVLWANNWLENKDRTSSSTPYAFFAAYATASFAASSASYASFTTSNAANAAVANAADAASSVNPKIDFIALAKKALTYS